MNAHTTIGTDRAGQLLLLEVDGCQADDLGKTDVAMAELLLTFGALHAINLDGGARSTIVENGRVLNHPTALGHWEPPFEADVESIVCIL